MVCSDLSWLITGMIELVENGNGASRLSWFITRMIIDLIDPVSLSFLAFFFTAALQSPRPLSWLTIDGLLNIPTPKEE